MIKRKWEGFGLLVEMLFKMPASHVNVLGFTSQLWFLMSFFFSCVILGGSGDGYPPTFPGVPSFWHLCSPRHFRSESVDRRSVLVCLSASVSTFQLSKLFKKIILKIREDFLKRENGLKN